MSESLICTKISRRHGLQSLSPEARADLLKTMEICDDYCEFLRKLLAIAEFSISSALDQIEITAVAYKSLAVKLFSVKTRETLLPVLTAAAS